jgi:hypothetical protein
MDEELDDKTFINALLQLQMKKKKKTPIARTINKLTILFTVLNILEWSLLRNKSYSVTDSTETTNT